MSAGAGAIFSTAGNMLTSMINNMWASQMASEDRAENYRYGEMAANNADKRTRALYNDFYSPQALLRQYQEAGLSPSLMFNGTPGQGGMSGAQGSGAAGIQTHFMPMSLVDAAQAAALFAQAEKTKEETTTEKETREGTIAKLWADAGYAKIATELTEAQKKQQEYQNYITDNTKDIQINQAYALAEQAANQATITAYQIIQAQVAAEVSEKTKEAQIEQATVNVNYTKAETLLTLAKKDLTEKEKKRATEEINKWRKELEIALNHYLNVDLYNSTTQRNMWRTMDEFMVEQASNLRERLNWEKEKYDSDFERQVFYDSYNALMDAFVNSANPRNMK